MGRAGQACLIHGGPAVNLAKCSQPSLQIKSGVSMHFELSGACSKLYLVFTHLLSIADNRCFAVLHKKQKKPLDMLSGFLASSVYSRQILPSIVFCLFFFSQGLNKNEQNM